MLGPIPEPDEWEVDYSSIAFGEVVGSGAFGKVTKATIVGLPGGPENKETVVAVKKLNAMATMEDRRNFLSEIEMMKQLGKHLNIVSILGCVTHAGQLCLITEYCPYGDLRNYLRAIRDKVSTRDSLAGRAPGRELTQNDLLSFARQIAVGMEYLSQKMFVHRDLAARNILICEDNLVKISDFGLTRDVYESSEYHKMHNTGKLPLKWMAPEAIFQNVHTTKSDVWAFGVVLWEIVTLGGSPYPGQSGKEFYKKLKNGYRMEKPDMCSPELYAMMRSCWASSPEDRPTFTKLRNQLEQLMDREDELYIDVNFEDAEYSYLATDSSSSGRLSQEPLLLI
ncbi:predicted protein [Nematostella vectensis]|uniref:Protein kinase domain-containing protein n=1 Tax=Nematostella vectensis TaxID=45351 RepID=A7RGW8_NEMVE|nr:predicted protein [Nematostella vectensis]|eukprot:XP_001641189.1 predicted protein [Nematostella vectensis]